MTKKPTLTLAEKVDDIMSNHLPTLEKKLIVVSDRVRWLIVLNVGIAIAVVAEVILGRL